jgi:hypothetical protein
MTMSRGVSTVASSISLSSTSSPARSACLGEHRGDRAVEDDESVRGVLGERVPLGALDLAAVHDVAGPERRGDPLQRGELHPVLRVDDPEAAAAGGDEGLERADQRPQHDALPGAGRAGEEPLQAAPEREPPPLAVLVAARISPSRIVTEAGFICGASGGGVGEGVGDVGQDDPVALVVEVALPPVLRREHAGDRVGERERLVHDPGGELRRVLNTTCPGRSPLHTSISGTFTSGEIAPWAPSSIRFLMRARTARPGAPRAGASPARCPAATAAATAGRWKRSGPRERRGWSAPLRGGIGRAGSALRGESGGVLDLGDDELVHAGAALRLVAAAGLGRVQLGESGLDAARGGA